MPGPLTRRPGPPAAEVDGRFPWAPLSGTTAWVSAPLVPDGGDMFSEMQAPPRPVEVAKPRVSPPLLREAPGPEAETEAGGQEVGPGLRNQTLAWCLPCNREGTPSPGGLILPDWPAHRGTPGARPAGGPGGQRDERKGRSQHLDGSQREGQGKAGSARGADVQGPSGVQRCHAAVPTSGDRQTESQDAGGHPCAAGRPASSGLSPDEGENEVFSKPVKQTSKADGCYRRPECPPLESCVRGRPAQSAGVAGDLLRGLQLLQAPGRC